AGYKIAGSLVSQFVSPDDLSALVVDGHRNVFSRESQSPPSRTRNIIPRARPIDENQTRLGIIGRRPGVGRAQGISRNESSGRIAHILVVIGNHVASGINPFAPI